MFNEKDSIALKKVVNSYGTYFERKGQKKRLNVDMVYKDHPSIWGEKPIARKFSKDELLSSIDDEIREASKQTRKSIIDISNIKLYTSNGNLKIYQGKLFINDDKNFSFSEGQMLTLISPAKKNYYITVLDFQSLKEELTFQLSQELDFYSGKIKFSNSVMLYKLKEEIEEINFEESVMINKLFINKDFPNTISSNEAIYNKGLDDSQSFALEKTLKNDITFIWGPPGTGKSHTLSRILLNLYEKNETTVVSSIANVAIDGLLENTVTLLNEEYFKRTKRDLLKERKMVRLGFSQSEKVRQIKELQFDNKEIRSVVYKLQVVDEKISDIQAQNIKSEKDEESLHILISQRIKLKEEHERLIKSFINESKTIFLTSAKFVFDSAVKNIEIDNLIIDEGSMMAIPHLLVLAQRVKKRIIISGDYRQLGPIALSNSAKAKKWLHKGLFDILGNKEEIINHESLSMLQEQRRSASDIVELINEPFYQGKLKTKNLLSHLSSKDLPPREGQHLVFVELPKGEDVKAEFSKSRSKYNSTSRKKVLQLINEIIEANPKNLKSIGVISPYKQQIIDYKLDLEELDVGFEIKVGTIHTFQGSECDVIIWDIVDTINNEVGLLYKEETGERLVNVAISRAKSKLIIVGHHRVFNEAKGNDLVSNTVRQILSKAWLKSHS